MSADRENLAAHFTSDTLANELYNAIRAAALRDAERTISGFADTAQVHERARTLSFASGVLRAMAEQAGEKAIAPAPTATPQHDVAYVYKAAWGMTPLGTYTNAKAARIHCETDATNHEPDPTNLTFDWLGDDSEPDDPYELAIAINGDEQPTDYTVTRIAVASEYDPEDDD